MRTVETIFEEIVGYDQFLKKNIIKAMEVYAEERVEASRDSRMLSEVASEEIRQLKEELAKYKSAVESLTIRITDAENQLLSKKKSPF